MDGAAGEIQTAIDVLKQRFGDRLTTNQTILDRHGTDESYHAPKAPDAVVASARGTGNAGGVNAEVPAGWAANRTRPLCAYPKVAKYKGSGSLELAENFSCQ